MEINVVPNDQRERKLPPTVEDLKSVARSALESQEQSYKDTDRCPSNLMARFSQEGEGQLVSASVHCECALTLHLERRNTRPSPLLYIGMSKLSCLPCWLFIQCLQEQGINYRVRGRLSNLLFPMEIRRGRTQCLLLSGRIRSH